MTRDEVMKKWKKREGEDSSLSSYQKGDGYKRYAERQLSSAIESSYGKGMEAIGNVYNGWNSESQIAKNKAIASEAYRDINKVRNTYGIDTYDAVINDYGKKLNSIDSMGETYSKYVNADAYNKAKKDYDLKQKYKGASYEDIQKALGSAADVDEIHFLRNYTDYSTPEDFDKAIAERESKRQETQKNRKGKVVDVQEDNLRNAKSKLEAASRYDKYSGLASNEDFAQYSDPTQILNAENGMDTAYYKQNKSLFDRSITSGSFNAVRLNEMNEEMQRMGAYILNTQGEKAYLEYMRDMTDYVRNEQAKANQEMWSGYAEEHPVLTTIGSATLQPVVGGLAGVEQLVDYANGHKTVSSLTGMSSAMSGATAEISQNIKNEHGYLPSFAYDVFATGVPNRLGQMLFGSGYNVVMGLQSFADTYANEINNGTPAGTALLNALVTGGIETLTEQVGMEWAFGESKGAIETVLKQAFAEGSEEVVGSLANLIYDINVNGGEAEYYQNVNKYIEMGYDTKDARDMASKDWIKDVAHQFAVAAFSTVPTTGVSQVARVRNESKMGELIDREQLANIGSEELQKKYGEEWTQKASNREVYNAYDKYVTETREQATETEKGESVKALMNEYNLSEEEATKYIEALYDGKNTKILKTHFGSAIKEEADTNTGWASKGDYSESSKYVDKLYDASRMVKSEDQVKAEKASKALKVGEDNTVNGEKAEIISMKTNKDGSYTVKTSKGEVDAKEVTVTENKAKALAYSADMTNEPLKEAFVHYYQGEDLYDYDQYVRTAYEAGINSLDLSEFTEVLDGLGKAKAMAFYNLGAEKTLREELATEEALDKVIKAYKSKNTTGKFESGVFTDGKFKKSDDIYRNLNRTQKKLYKVVEAFSRLSGINTRVFVDRSAASKNGEFVSGSDGGVISINLAARPYGDSAYGINKYVVSTLSHELTHWMKANNREAYDILENAIVESLTEKGTLEKHIKTEQDNYKKVEGKELSREIALEEVVARACEDMLNSTETMSEVLSHTDMNGLEKLKAAFEEWFNHIKEFFNELMSGFSSPNEITQSLSKEYEDLRKLWIKGINDAINGKRSGQQTSEKAVASSKEVRNSLPQSVLDTLSEEDRNNYQAFSNVIDSYIARTHPSRQHLKVMDYTPNLLQQIGLGNKEIYMTKKHYNDITHTEDGIHSQYHGLTPVEVKEAPILLNNAAIIVDSITDPTSIVVISISLDYRKRPIILSLRTDGEGQGIELVDSNFMTSIYGKDGFTNWLSQFIPNDVLYISKKYSQMLKGFGVSFPAGFDTLDYDKILHQSRNAVKANHVNSLKLSERETKALDTLNVEVEGGYAYPKFNLKTYRESDYNKNIDIAAAALAKQMEISVDQAKKYIKDVGSIANIISKDQDRLDYLAIEGKSAWVSNPEYGGSLDYSFLCPKRLTYTGTMNAILRKQNDLIFSVDDFLWLRKALITAGYEAPCSFCFVESARARFGKYNQQFLDIAKEEKLAYIPTAEELTNPDKLEEMREQHPETYRRYEKFLNSLSQRKPKMLEERRAYNGDILKDFLGKEDTIKSKNLHGGIRFNSFSDFEIVHMLDCMQAIMDMSRVGLAGFGYTKQKAFAQIFGKTGLKINMSCVAKGIEADGKHIIFDDVEGMNHEEALKLRNGNVGIVCVVFNDAQLKAALCDERIDYVLPFHRSQWSKKEYEKMGLSLDTKDYTKPQTEKLGTKKAKEGNIPFLSYWNENQTGVETVQRYLDIINEQGKTPIFPMVLEKVDGKWTMPKGIKKNGKFINKTEEIKEKAAENYWKLLTEFKLYDNNGKPVGQSPVKPTFNMKAARELLKDYDGSHKEFPVAQNVVDAFFKYKKTGESDFEWKRSSNKMDSEGKTLAEVQASKMTSLEVLDEEYNKAIKDNRMDLAKHYVRQAAQNAGYTSPLLFHGTPSFGFTEFRTPYVYGTTKREVAANYGGRQNYAASRPIGIKYDNSDTYAALVKNAKSVLGQTIRRATEKDVSTKRQKILKEAENISQKLDELFADDFNMPEDIANHYAWVSNLAYAIEENDKTYFGEDEYANTEGWKESLKDDVRHFSNSIAPLKEYLVEHKDDYKDTKFEKLAKYLRGYEVSDFGIDVEYTYLPLVVGNALVNTETGSILTENGVRKAIEANVNVGAYELYGKPGENPLVIDANGRDWVVVKADKWDGKDHTTDDIAIWAKQNGYSSVIIKNVYDGGERADDYIFFNSESLKSADAVTYDDDGNVIPLSQRFKKSNKDIRYSSKMDSDGKALTKDQAKFYAKSKIRDDENRLKVMYHGTDKGGFTVFDNEKSDDKLSFFFTDQVSVADSYSGTLIRDLNKKMWGENGTNEYYERFEKQWKGDKVDYFKQGKVRKTFDSAFEAAKWWCEENGIPIDVFKADETRDTYKVYLNIQNPYVLDARYSKWNRLMLPEDFEGKEAIIKEVYDFIDLASKQTGDDYRMSYILETLGELEYAIQYEIDELNKRAEDIDLEPLDKETENKLLTMARDIDKAYEEWNPEEHLDKDGEEIYFSDFLTFGGKKFRTTRSVAKWAKEHGYDGVYFKNIVDVGAQGDWQFEASNVAIAFYPNQIKTVDNLHPTDSDDIRYSAKIDSQGSSLTEEQVKYFKDSKVRDENGNLLVMYHGTQEEFNTFKPNSFIKELNGTSKIVGYFSEDRDYAEIYGDVGEYYLNITNPLVMTGEAMTVEEWEKFFEKNGVKGIIFDSSITGKKGQKDPLKGGTFDGVTYYTFYELLDMSNYWYGDGNLTEMIQKAGYDGIQSNDEDEKAWMPFNANAVKRINNLNPTSNKDTRKSDKMSYDELSDEAKDRIRELEEEVGRLSDENAALRAEKNMEKINAEKKVMVDKITEQAKILSRWLLENDKKNPVPQSVRIPLGNFLTSIDFTKDSYEWRKSHGTLTKSEESLGTRMSKISQMLLDLDQDKAVDKDAYDMSQLDWIPQFSNEFAKIKDTIAEVESKEGERFHLGKMSHDDLQNLLNLITALKTSIINMNKCLSAHNKMSVEGVGKEVISYLDRIGQKNGGIDWLEISNTTPYYFFQRLGAGGEQTFKLLMDGMSKYAFEAKQIEDYAKETFKGEDVKKWRDEVKTFEVEEYEVKTDKKEGEMPLERKLRTIQMTVPQIMSLYCLSKRDQAMKHIQTGGIRVGTFETKENGKKSKVRQIDNVTLTEKDLKKILSTLTEPQKDVADKLQKFMNDVCQKWGNEVTMKRFGYKGMTEKNYFPINVDRNQLSKEARQKGSSLYQLLNMGFTKPINPKAKNPIEIFDIFETFTIHATEMAQYNSLALPVLDVIKIWNYRDQELLDEAENKAHWHSVKGSIESALGEKANGYIGRLLADLNGDVTLGRADSFAKKFMKNYKTAAVAANLQVAALQPISYIRAGYMVDNKYLTKALAMKSDKDKCLKYCGIALWKEMGFYNTAINNGLEHMIMQDDSKKDKAIEKTLYLAGKMDEWTWGKLWNACLLETKDNYPSLEGEDLYKQTGERLTEVIYGTQVVDSILTRSDLMRDTTFYTSMVTAFQSEPTLSLNILMDAAVRFDQEKRANGAQAALKVHGDKIKRAALVYITSCAVESILRAVIGKIRNYDGDDDDETLIEDFIKRFIEELNPLRKIPIVREIAAIVIDTVKVLLGKQYKLYTDTRMDEAIFENVGKSVIRIGNIIKGKSVNYKAVYEIAKGVDASGLPFSSIIRELKVIWNNTIGRAWESLIIK